MRKLVLFFSSLTWQCFLCVNLWQKSKRIFFIASTTSLCMSAVPCTRCALCEIKIFVLCWRFFELSGSVAWLAMIRVRVTCDHTTTSNLVPRAISPGNEVAQPPYIISLYVYATQQTQLLTTTHRNWRIGCLDV